MLKSHALACVMLVKWQKFTFFGFARYSNYTFQVWWAMNNQFVENLKLNATVKKFWKSANIWQSCGQSCGPPFFDSQCTTAVKLKSWNLWLTICILLFLFGICIMWKIYIKTNGLFTKLLKVNIPICAQKLHVSVHYWCMSVFSYIYSIYLTLPCPRRG